MAICYQCQGEGLEVVECGFWERPCSVCGGAGYTDDDPDEAVDFGDYLAWLQINEPDRHAMLYDAGFIDPRYEQVSEARG